ncbi:MAG: MmgE/PrpD family protein [Alphaproteobacteria bacterium]|nr:MmgE/PrpD family protein [Alphaproteobacteria bacterium]
MRQTAGREAQTPHVTHELARFASGIRYENLPEDVRFMARQCLLDWLGVTLAGSQEPLALMLKAEAAEEGGAPRATLIGGGAKTSMGQAALVNGAAGHALDFDDVLGAMTGHPTAPVAPVALALAEGRGLDGRRVVAGIVAGIEVEARIGRVLGDSHYARGWHATGTVGAFGAAAAAANMLGLDAGQTARAFGIAGTQAAGLKSMFGTMCKPLHAGKAARNGLMAATLAERGFTSRDDVLDCVQGFTDTQTETFRPEALLEEPDRFHILDTLFKYHPACYGTHATIEACLGIAENPAFEAGDVERVEVKVPMSALRMCNIPAPETGLEAKFSLAYNVGLGLTKKATGALDIYFDENLDRPDVHAIREAVSVEGSGDMPKFAADVVVHLGSGVVLRGAGDVGVPANDLGRQWEKLQGKFRALAAPLLGGEAAETLIGAVGSLDGTSNLGTALAPAGAEIG